MFCLTPHAGTDDIAFGWAQVMVERYHYLHKPVDPRSRPLAYIVHLDREAVGCLIFGRTQSTSCFQGVLTYGSQTDVATGRAVFDRWEVLNLARVWLSPDVQQGGRLCLPDRVPGFTDRGGVWRPAVASHAICLALGSVGFDYLMAHPPCFTDEPYAIRAVLSYCDTRKHRGVIYRAAGFRLARTNEDGIETWWTSRGAPLTPAQDAAVRHRSARDGRAARIRGQRVVHPSLF